MGFRLEIPGVGEVKGDTPDETAKSVVSTVSNTVNRTLDDASRGDVGKAISTQVTAGANLLTLPVKTVYYAARGDNKGVSDTFQRAAGSLTNISGSIGVNLAQNNQSFYRDKTLNDLTFGYAQDFAGFARGARTLQDNAYLSTEDRNSAIRYGTKSAAIWGATLAAPEVISGAQKAGSYIWSTVAEHPFTAAVTGKLLTEGKTSQAINYLSGKGAFDGVSDLLPQLPNAPSELTDLFDFLNPKSNQPSYLSGSTGTQVNDPWDFSGSADSGISAQTSIMPYLLIGGLLIGSLLIFRGRK